MDTRILNGSLVIAAIATMAFANSASAQNTYFNASFCEEEYVTGTHTTLQEGAGGIYNSSTTAFSYVDCPTERPSSLGAASVCVQVDVSDNSNDSGSTGIVSCTAISYTAHFGGFVYTSLSSSPDTATGDYTLQGTVSSTNYSATTVLAIDCSLPHWDVSHSDIFAYALLTGGCLF